MKDASKEPALILVVEDDPANQLLTQAVLEQAGHRVLAAASAEEARRLIEDRAPAGRLPDLVLTDIQLPGASGLELARSLACDARTRALPVVAVTAHAQPEVRRRALEAGCRDCIVKPVDIAELVRRVEASLRPH